MESRTLLAIRGNSSGLALEDRMRRFAFVFAGSLLFVACSNTVTPPVDSGTGDSSILPPNTMAAKIDYCKTCMPTVNCTTAKPISACCVCTQQPKYELERATGLV